MATGPLSFDPIAEARRQWALHWEGSDAMAAATSIMRVQQILLGVVDRALSELGLTFARYEALVLLHFSRQGSLPLGKMGERLQVHPTSVTNLVDRLEQQGLVRRTRHPTDRRTTLAEITEQGRVVVEKASAAVVATGFALDGLSPEDRTALTAILRKARLHAGDFVPPPDPCGAGRAEPGPDLARCAGS
ncbi:MAG: MarR family winged helix-turn-helix transcriptional regulator, partial [Acidimicrobiales bacterium]